MESHLQKLLNVFDEIGVVYTVEQQREAGSLWTQVCLGEDDGFKSNCKIFEFQDGELAGY